MYLINKQENNIQKIPDVTFSELGFKERQNLQEWIAKNPNVLGEDLLIIQKEFAGFLETKERLDLLALDKNGDLVVIENKLDDSGKDVTWQALKYASYCSSLTKSEVISIYNEYLDKYSGGEIAHDNLKEFFDVDEIDEISINVGSNQRVILIAANFRKEVTSTVMWLLEKNIRLQCFKVTPHQLKEQLFLDIDQIIPVKDAEEFLVKRIKKDQEDQAAINVTRTSHKKRLIYWRKLLLEYQKSSNLFAKISPSKESWISAGSGCSGISYIFVVTKSESRTELYIDTGSKELNKKYFDQLVVNQSVINEELGIIVQWNRFNDKNASKLSHVIDRTYYDEEKHNELINEMVGRMTIFENVFKKYIHNLSR